MIKKTQNLFFFFFVFLFFSCDDSKKITITKVNGSPSYENAKLSITDLAKDKDEYSFLFDSSNY